MSRGDGDFVIDLEGSSNTAIENGKVVGEGKNFLSKVWCCLVVCDGSNRFEKAASFESRLHNGAEVRLQNGEALVVDKKVGGDEKMEKVVGAEKPKQKSCKKPPKPPRPPRPVSLDSADHKLIREISELALLKRARVERMKALKKIKNGKAASFSAVNTFALVITLIFCVVIFWQGVFPQGGGSSNSSSRFITIQFYSNASTNAASI